MKELLVLLLVLTLSAGTAAALTYTPTSTILNGRITLAQVGRDRRDRLNSPPRANQQAAPLYWPHARSMPAAPMSASGNSRHRFTTRNWSKKMTLRRRPRIDGLVNGPTLESRTDRG
jgi:hypothetical protein